MSNDDPILNGYRESLLDLLQMRRSFVSATNDNLIDADGCEIYDALAQYGTVVLGHNHEAVTASVFDFLGANGCCFVQPNVSEPTAALARRLIELSGDQFRRVCFSNSGAESVEAAIKLARLSTGRPKIVSLKNSFHGKTFAALSASGSDRYKGREIADTERHIVITPGDLIALESALAGGDIAAFLFEPVLGEGGMECIDPTFLRAAIDLCGRHGAVTVADEIQCGLYRCGSFSVAITQNLDIDLLLLGKGLSGGLMPIGAMLYSELPGIAEFEKKHSSTFAGGGLACRVGVSVLTELSNERMACRVDELSSVIDMQATKLYEEIRCVTITGVGLLRGVAFSDPNRHDNYFAVFCHNSGLLAYILCSYLLKRHSVLTMPLLSRDCAIRFEPPLTTTPEKIEKFFKAVADIGKLLDAGRYDLLMAHLVDVDPDTLDSRLKRFSVTNRTLPLAESLPYDVDSPERYDFAFLMHVTDREDIIRIFPKAVHRGYDRAAQIRLAELFLTAGELDPSPAICLAFKMPNGARSVNGLLLLSPISAGSMMRLSKLARKKLLDEYFALVTTNRVSRVGLGGYTSVISGAGSSLVEKYPDVGITTGNRLTSVAIVDQFRLLYPSCNGPGVCIIGARGSVGAALTLELARSVPQLFLLGRSMASVSTYKIFLIELFDAIMLDSETVDPGSVAWQIKRYAANKKAENLYEAGSLVDVCCSDDLDSQKPVIVSSALEQAIDKVNYIVSCTSEGKSFIDTASLRKGVVVLDGARPFDFVTSCNSLARVYQAGLTYRPYALAIGDCNMAIDQANVGLACFNETLMLAAAGITRNYGVGSSMSHEEMEAIRQLAVSEGYTSCLLEPRVDGTPAKRAPQRESESTVKIVNCIVEEESG